MLYVIYTNEYKPDASNKMIAIKKYFKRMNDEIPMFTKDVSNAFTFTFRENAEEMIKFFQKHGKTFVIEVIE